MCERSLAGIRAASAPMIRVERETVNCPLGIHDSRRGEGRSGARSGPSHGQAEGQSVTHKRPSQICKAGRGLTLKRHALGPLGKQLPCFARRRRSALPGMADCRTIAKSAPGVPWEAAHCDLSYPRHAPNHVSDIVCYQQSPIRPDRHPYGSPIGLLLVRREKTR